MSETVTVEWDSAGDGGFATDISGYVRTIQTNRGRKTDLGRMPPGTATLVLNNHDGRFSPDKGDGPHFGDLEMYRRVRIKGAVDGNGTYGIFYGFVLNMDNKPRMNQQVVTWNLGDRFALWQHMMLNLPLLRKVPVKCALDMAVNRAMGDNECDNPSVETNLDDYSGLQGITPTRDPTMKIEGDYTVLCDCPGDNAGEGWRFTCTGDVDTLKPIIARVWVRASAEVELKFRAYSDPDGERGEDTVTVGTTPTLLEFLTFLGFKAAEAHYFELYTTGATEVMFWSDGLYFITPSSQGELFMWDFDDGTAEIELAVSYRQSALEVIQAIAESEPRSFLFPYCGNISYLERLRFWDKDHRAVASSAIFSDDGGDVPYQDLLFAEHALDRISECELVSQGDYEDENKETTIWELSPIGQIIAATETEKFRAVYATPARDCSLEVDSPPRNFPSAADTDDGYILYQEAAHPPTVCIGAETTGSWVVGQGRLGATYFEWRGYVRFDTSGLPDGADITASTLKLYLHIDKSTQEFTIQVRDSAWPDGAVLACVDWDGTGAIRGTFATVDLPPAGQYIEIDIAVAAINKTGWTEFEITSNREIANTAPADGVREDVIFRGSGSLGPILTVTYTGYEPASQVFNNYGIGADIEITAPATPLTIAGMRVIGVPLRGSMEESKIVQASASPPAIERTLKYALPLQGTRTASMETEASRLADRYDGRIKRCSIILRPETDAVLTQMLAREIGDKIHVENIAQNFSTHIDADFFIQGIDHDIKISKHTVVHETTFHLEEA